MILTHYISQHEFCRKNEIFNNAKNHLEKYYFNNERFLKRTIKNTRLNNLLTSNNHTDNINYDI